MTFQLKRAERKKAFLKLGIAGPSGSGKTYSGLLVAKGLVGDWEKVAVIDTENGSADLYSDLGPYNTLTLEPPFEPEKFLKALDVCVESGMGAVIIDSISHEWMGEGGVLDYQSSLGGKFTDWAKATPRHRRFIDGILQAQCHVICCSRVKTEWAVDQNEKGKTMPKKVGLKIEQREGIEYEFTVAWRLSQTHMAETDKDRTGLFMGKADFKLSEQTGKVLAEWANSGAAVPATEAKKPGIYTGEESQQKIIQGILAKQKVPEGLWPEIDQRLRGRPSTDLRAAVEEAKNTAGVFS